MPEPIVVETPKSTRYVYLLSYQVEGNMEGRFGNVEIDSNKPITEYVQLLKMQEFILKTENAKALDRLHDKSLAEKWFDRATIMHFQLLREVLPEHDGTRCECGDPQRSWGTEYCRNCGGRMDLSKCGGVAEVVADNDKSRLLLSEEINKFVQQKDNNGRKALITCSKTLGGSFVWEFQHELLGGADGFSN